MTDLKVNFDLCLYFCILFFFSFSHYATPSTYLPFYLLDITVLTFSKLKKNENDMFTFSLRHVINYFVLLALASSNHKRYDLVLVFICVIIYILLFLYMDSCIILSCDYIFFRYLI